MQGLVDLSIRAEIGIAGERWQQDIGDLAIPGAFWGTISWIIRQIKAISAAHSCNSRKFE